LGQLRKEVAYNRTLIICKVGGGLKLEKRFPLSGISRTLPSQLLLTLKIAFIGRDHYIHIGYNKNLAVTFSSWRHFFRNYYPLED
jgi:hypothetical protein